MLRLFVIMIGKKIIFASLFLVVIVLCNFLLANLVLPLKINGNSGNYHIKGSNIGLWLIRKLDGEKILGEVNQRYEITLTELSQKNLRVFSETTGDMIQSVDFEETGNTARIKVNYSPKYFSEIFTSYRKTSDVIEPDLLAYLCIANTNLDINSCRLKVKQLIKIYDEKFSWFGRIFWVKKNFGIIGEIRIVRDVFAGCIGGTYDCGLVSSVCKCSYGGGSCSYEGLDCAWSNALADYQGTCHCTDTCTATSSKNCSGEANQSSCENDNRGRCAAGECVTSKSCSWVCITTSWGDCSKTCGGGTQTDNCGDTRACNTQACCTDTNPAKVVLTAPEDAAELKVGSNFDWNATSSWGEECSGTATREYRLCVGSSSTNPCTVSQNGESFTTTATTLPFAGTGRGNRYWEVQAKNKASNYSAMSNIRQVCIEGGPYLGAWSSCDSNHERVRTCTEDCGTNDCTAIASEDCIGTITGTLFDASEVSDSCTPAEIAAAGKFTNQAFDINPTPNAAKWPIISATAPTETTNGNGAYSQAVYASTTLPANYVFDYTALINSGQAAGIKTQCGVSMAAVTTQGQVLTKNTGFWRVYGGWWQAAGGSVYAETNLRSTIPASMAPLVAPFVNQKLIVPVGGRTGVLNHGFAWIGSELGTNPNAAVSVAGYQVQSVYEGLRYDYNFYNTRMDVFASTPWAGGGISYNDGGVGYQIFKATGNYTLNAVTFSAVTKQKAILLVDGNVTVNGNLTVPSGAFLGVIASGSITFNSNVTDAQGWFVAENINFPCRDTVAPIGTCDKTDTQFDGQGSFVAWTDFGLRRDIGAGNNTAPSEKFTYRPDMVLNAPTPIKVYSKKFSPFIP